MEVSTFLIYLIFTFTFAQRWRTYQYEDQFAAFTAFCFTAFRLSSTFCSLHFPPKITLQKFISQSQSYEHSNQQATIIPSLSLPKPIPPSHPPSPTSPNNPYHTYLPSSLPKPLIPFITTLFLITIYIYIYTKRVLLLRKLDLLVVGFSDLHQFFDPGFRFRYPKPSLRIYIYSIQYRI